MQTTTVLLRTAGSMAWATKPAPKRLIAKLTPFEEGPVLEDDFGFVGDFWSSFGDADNGEAAAFSLLGTFACEGTGRTEDKDFTYNSYHKSLELGYSPAWFALSTGWRYDGPPPEGLVS